MPLDPYVSCPCGSGKKFKWCCSPYFAQVEKAFGLEQQGQYETALQTILALTKSHPNQPAVWGYYAQFLYSLGQAQQTQSDQAHYIEQAEAALSEALRLNPNFGMAHYLRGRFRLNEGELIGALMLFRKAADTYDPEAHDQLAHVHELIFQNEMLLNRPVAARAALERVLHFQPAGPEIREHFEILFGEKSRLPHCVRKKYTFRPTAKPIAANAATGKLSDARKAFETLTQRTPSDPAVWFNLGVVLAWLGEQPKAVDALNTSVDLETDDHRAEEAAALAEVLRCGHGMENDADYLEHGFYLPIRDPKPVVAWLQAMERSRRLLGVQADQETGSMTAMVVEELPSLLAFGSLTVVKVVARLNISRGIIRVWHPDRDSVARIAAEIRTRLNLAVEQPTETITPINFADVVLGALAFPTQNTDHLRAQEKLRDFAQHYFESGWIHRPLQSLGGNSPLDAVGSSRLRKRVFGAVKFIADCFTGMVPLTRIGDQVMPMVEYDFATLQHKLGLEYITADPPKVEILPDPEPAPVPVAVPVAAAPPATTVVAEPPAPAVAAPLSAPTPAPLAPPAKREIPAMNAAELAGLDVAVLSVDELEQSMKAALKLDARELAVAFALAGVQKPFDPSKLDRYPLYACLITGALSEGDTAKAVQFANDGAWYDGERNENRRANEYGLRKAQLYSKQKNVEKATEEFEVLIARNPDEGRYYTTAAEEMLRLKNGAKAAYFADKGLARARETGNRDLEGHCLELQAAAKRI
jgi:tetratricopeptide (TPR) repeat protein